MGRRAHRRSLRRSRPRIEPRRRLLIVCEGKVTEPNYFQSLRHEHRNRLVEVEIIPEGGVPKTLVEYGVERKREAEREARRYGDPYRKYDEVWCVFDVDVHPNLAEAKQQAHDNGLISAISNPCFELWMLLHFQDQFRAEHRAVIQRACRTHLPDYEKEAPYESLYGQAVRRAEHLDNLQKDQDNEGGNPSTGVYRLTERIRKLGKDQFLREAAG